MKRRPVALSGDPVIDVPMLASKLSGNIEESTAICSMLRGIDHVLSLEALIAATQHRDQWLRRLAVETIGNHELGRRALQTLRRSLSDKSSFVVSEACRGIGKLRLREARNDLLPLLDSRQVSTCCAAINALAAVAEESDFERLLKRLDGDPHPEVEHTIEHCLALMAGPENWQMLYRLWHTSTAEHRRLSACRLAQSFANADHLPDIESLMDDESDAVRKAAHQAIQAIRGEPEIATSPKPVPKNTQWATYCSNLSKNDGWTDNQYQLSEDTALNDRVSDILNEACHVFYHHAGGTWRSQDKDYYALQLAREIEVNPWLKRALLDIKDRVISMVAYRAVELLKSDSELDRRKKLASFTGA